MSWTFGPLPLAGSPTAGGAVPSVETWAGASQAPCRRVAALAVYALALAFVPVVTAAPASDIAAGVQGGAPPLRSSTLQYQAVTGPVFVPAVAGETVTLDKWVSQPPHRPRLAWRPAGGTVAPLHVPDVTQPVTARAWAPTYPDRAPGKPRPVAFPQAVAPLYVPDVTVVAPPLSWAEALPDVVRRPRVVTGGSVAPVAVDAPAEVLTLDKWHAAPALRVTVQRRPTGGTVAPVAPVVVETPVLDWLPSVSIPVARQTRPTGGTVGPLFVADVTDPAPLRSWSAIAPDVVRPRRLQALGGIVAPVAPFADAPASTDQAPAVQGGTPPLRTTTLQYQALTGPVLVPAEAPAVALDWQTSLPSGPFAKDGPAIQYAPLTGPVERVLELDWLGQCPAPVRARRVVTGGVVAPVAPVAAAPAVVLDWLGPIAHAPVISRRPVGGTVDPLYVADVTVVAPHRSWAPSLADVVRLRRLVPEGYAVRPVMDLGVPEVLTLDKWHAPHVTITRRVLRPAGGTVAPVYVPDVTVIAPLRSWAPVVVDVPRARRVVLAGGVVGPVAPLAVAETLTLDKWHNAPALRPVSRRTGATVTVAPVFVPDVTVDPRTWAPVVAGPVPIRPRPTGGSVAPVVVPDVTVVPPLRSWAPILPERRDIQRPVNVGGACGRIDPPSPYVPTYRYTAIVPREDRAIVVPGESRAVVVAYESRLIVVPYESRVIIVPRDPRAASQED